MEAIINLIDEDLKEDIIKYEAELEKEGKIMFVTYAEQAGIKKGKLEGIQEGKLQGKLEGKLEVARNLLARGVSPDIIAESADLPLEKIRGLMN
jgi:predicted transposase/invertase (TIGR01784 family)